MTHSHQSHFQADDGKVLDPSSPVGFLGLNLCLFVVLPQVLVCFDVLFYLLVFFLCFALSRFSVCFPRNTP